mmetsp:Transcript_10686/g.24928  ORF Transcript_10686/g.24928 Transcript_10686/m.24928 type:complete len:113 (+) Transcript_10686:2237-2575(+)
MSKLLHTNAMDCDDDDDDDDDSLFNINHQVSSPSENESFVRLSLFHVRAAGWFSQNERMHHSRQGFVPCERHHHETRKDNPLFVSSVEWICFEGTITRGVVFGFFSCLVQYS